MSKHPPNMPQNMVLIAHMISELLQKNTPQVKQAYEILYRLHKELPVQKRLYDNTVLLLPDGSENPVWLIIYMRFLQTIMHRQFKRTFRLRVVMNWHPGMQACIMDHIDKLESSGILIPEPSFKIATIFGGEVQNFSKSPGYDLTACREILKMNFVEHGIENGLTASSSAIINSRGFIEAALKIDKYSNLVIAKDPNECQKMDFIRKGLFESSNSHMQSLKFFPLWENEKTAVVKGLIHLDYLLNPDLKVKLFSPSESKGFDPALLLYLRAKKAGEKNKTSFEEIFDKYVAECLAELKNQSLPDDDLNKLEEVLSIPTLSNSMYKFIRDHSLNTYGNLSWK